MGWLQAQSPACRTSSWSRKYLLLLSSANLSPQSHPRNIKINCGFASCAFCNHKAALATWSCSRGFVQSLSCCPYLHSKDGFKPWQQGYINIRLFVSPMDTYLFIFFFLKRWRIHFIQGQSQLGLTFIKLCQMQVLMSGRRVGQCSDASLSISILQIPGKQMRRNVMLTTCFTISIKSTTGMGQKLSPNAHKRACNLKICVAPGRELQAVIHWGEAQVSNMIRGHRYETGSRTSSEADSEPHFPDRLHVHAVQSANIHLSG